MSEFIGLSKREVGTLRAALMFWKNWLYHPDTKPWVATLATCDGTVKQLTDDEIDEMLEQISVCDHPSTFGGPGEPDVGIAVNAEPSIVEHRA